MHRKTALITGSSGLIGTELCRQFLAQGMEVYGLDLHPGKLKDPFFTHIKCDLAKETSIRSALRRIKNLDVVINNAAVTDLHPKGTEQLGAKDWERGLAVNVTSFFLVTKYALPLLKRAKGTVVNVSSTRHLMSESDTLIYTASKGAIVSLTHSLAVSFGPDIRVNCISPGWIADPAQKLRPRDHGQHPVGRVGYPQDIASLALFLSSEASGFITGQDFVVDGGMTKKMIYQE